MSMYLENNDIAEFIKAFKNTSYYQYLFGSSEVLGIYLMGSMCTGITDEKSDYDITVITLDDGFEDCSEYEYLTYKGKKVHWYRNSITDCFSPQFIKLKILCPIQLRNICEDLTIYENPKYTNTLHYLYETKNWISVLGIYRLFELKKNYINDVLNEGQVFEKHYTKYLYHLCLASYYLTNEEPDKDFLRILKRIKWQPVPEEYKQLAVERLKVYKNYIEQNPLNIDDELGKICRELAETIC